MQTVLHGKFFLLTDDRGDVRHGTEGLYAHDARFLSHWNLRIDGRRPQPLGNPHGPHFQRSFVQRNIQGGTLAPDSLIVERRIFVGDAMYERVLIENITIEPQTFSVTFGVGSDYHDIFLVKKREFERLGDEVGDVGLLGARENLEEIFPVLEGETARITHGDSGTWIDATKPFTLNEDKRISWQITLKPRARWLCDIRVAWDEAARSNGIDFDRKRREVEQDTAMWLADTPMLVGGPERLRDAYRVSVHDLAALRIDSATGIVPAAGMPWFMTAFGRDTLITCLQTLALGAERAMAAVKYLALLQATEDDPEVDAEPGKILHEVREGAIADRGYAVYYGSIDSTPLFLVLLDEIHRWTQDDVFIEQYREHAFAALEWIEKHGDINDDGYLAYKKRSSQGLVNQSWKDSWDSQRFHDGRTAEGSIAPVEAQGYAYDARMRMARLARQVWKDEKLAKRLERDAAELKLRFNRDFWIPPEDVTPVGADDPRREGYFAMALDGSKQKVDALTSNIGHLLWSGIVDDDKVDAVVRQLSSRQMYNGWGIRTMSTVDSPYNPISYHNGTVWPHDTCLCIAGMMRVGAHDVAGRISHAMFDAAAEFKGRLPEVFAGLDRGDTGHPVEYPTASRPQAWAAATPIMMLTELIGLAPHPTRPELTLRKTAVPHWLDGLEWHGIRAFGSNWDVSVRHGIPVVHRR